MFVTKQPLPRRTFLRGMGATLSLPLLDAMVPALTAMANTAAAPARRIGFIYHPMGTIYEQWTPATEGAGFGMNHDGRGATEGFGIAGDNLVASALQFLNCGFGNTRFQSNL